MKESPPLKPILFNEFISSSFKVNDTEFISSLSTYIEISGHVVLVICNYNSELYSPTTSAELNIMIPKSVKSARIKRISSFLAGRYACKVALQRLKKPINSVLIGQSGAPVWPKEICGSISHTDTFAACVLSNKNACSTIGVDIEKIVTQDTLNDIKEYITTEAERAIFSLQDYLEYETFITLCFSAKESIYKAIHPIINFFFGFEAATLISINECELIFKLDREIAMRVPNLDSDIVTVNYELLNNNHIITLITI